MSRHYAWFTERKQTGIIYKEKIKIYNCLNEFLKSLPKEKPEHFYFYGINLIDPTIGASENEIIEFEITSFNIADNLHAKIDYLKNCIIREKTMTLLESDSQNRLTGQWSMDVMLSGNDFYIIDMALAEESYYYQSVPLEDRRVSKQNWIPKLS